MIVAMIGLLIANALFFCTGSGGWMNAIAIATLSVALIAKLF